MTARQRFILSLIDFHMRPVTVDEIAEAIDTNRRDVRDTLGVMERACLVSVTGDRVTFPAFAKAAA